MSAISPNASSYRPTVRLPLLLENMKETIEAIIDNVVARAFVKKGTKLQVYLGDRATDVAVEKDADNNPTEKPLFRVYMQSRLPNPHYSEQNFNLARSVPHSGKACPSFG